MAGCAELDGVDWYVPVPQSLAGVQVAMTVLTRTACSYLRRNCTPVYMCPLWLEYRCLHGSNRSRPDVDHESSSLANS